MNAISVVVPVLDEIRVLPDSLTALLNDPKLHQVIVVDGGSRDGTLDYLARMSHSKLTILHSRPGRGRQMNHGARRATGDWIIFHHVDSYLPESAGEAIAALHPEIRWGAFKHCFAPTNWRLWLISKLHNLRCRLSGTVYGDQSMFVRREFFWSLGGFCEAPLEDLFFSDAAMAQQKSHLLPLYVRTDARKFLQIGEWRALRQVVSIVLRYQRERRIGHDAFFRPYR